MSTKQAYVVVMSKCAGWSGPQRTHHAATILYCLRRKWKIGGFEFSIELEGRFFHAKTTPRTTPEKVAILKRHLLEKVAIPDLCEELGLNPTVFYQWQRCS